MAALLVLGHHLVPLLPGHTGLPYAYLAVDFFFLISGLVVAQAYRQRLHSNLNTMGFIWARLQRLLPMLMLAGLCSALEVLARWRFGTTLDQVPDAEILRAAAASFLAVPVPVEPALGHGNWPLNPPLWSLCVEMLVGVLAAAWLLRCPQRLLGTMACLAAAILVAAAAMHGTLDGGVFLFDAPVAMARMVWSFAIGLLIQAQVARQARSPDPRSVAWLAIGILIAVLLFAVIPWSGLVECLLVGLAGPAFVAYLWRHSGRLAYSGWCWRLAGELSYAIYALHWPLASLLRNGARHMGWLAQDSLVSVVWLGLAIVLISWVAVVGFERPARRRLGMYRPQ